MLIGKNTDTSRQKDGLSGFLSKWRMNALAFDFVYENTRIHDESSEPWYSIVPVSFRERMIDIASRVPLRTSAPTTVARLVTLSSFAMIYLAVLGNRIRQGGDAALLPVDAFVVLTGFLFLQPTVNPWYWTWVLPFACFIRNFGWHMAGGCLLFYYGRFWFKLSSIAIPLGGVEYTGVDCFDHLVVWVEYALLVALVVGLPRLDSKGDVASGH